MAKHFLAKVRNINCENFPKPPHVVYRWQPLHGQLLNFVAIKLNSEKKWSNAKEGQTTDCNDCRNNRLRSRSYDHRHIWFILSKSFCEGITPVRVKDLLLGIWLICFPFPFVLFLSHSFTNLPTKLWATISSLVSTMISGSFEIGTQTSVDTP